MRSSLSVILVFAACSSEPPKSAPVPAKEAPKAPTVQDLKISAQGALMLYDKGQLKVRAGGKIRLTLVNPPESKMEHNIVFVRPGKADAVAEQCAEEGSLKPDAEALKEVIAQSETIQPGTTTTLEFDSPPAGRYEYVCTVRGHSQTMRGWLIVEP